jgi:hypothetical protein
MRDISMAASPDSYRRTGTARRVPARAPLAPAQDASRYQARNMPQATYDLDRKKMRAPLLTILERTLALVAIFAGIDLIQRIGMWLTP